MSAEDLQVIDRVGPARSEELVDAGYETVASIAAADEHEIVDDISVSDSTAETIIKSAQSEAGQEIIKNETGTVVLTQDDQLIYHLLHAVLEEATSQMQSSNHLMQESAYEIADSLCKQIANDEKEYTITGDRKRMNTLFRAVSQAEMDYASRSGIPEMYGTLRAIKNDINDVREQL
jgi:hypothetical protein